MKLNHVQLDQNHMATTFHFRISCEEGRTSLAERALSEGHRKVAELELELTEFKPESPVYQLNQAEPFRKIRMTPVGIELLEISEKLRRLTANHFSPTAKSRKPEQPDLSGSRIAWDKDQRIAWRLDEGAHLGFGAVGKGYALDQVRLIVEQLGFHDYFLSGGGSSLIFSGFAGPQDPWKWGWSWKRDQDGDDLGLVFSHFTGTPVAIGVSGTHEKGSHILYPGKGNFEASALSALVSHSSAAVADALSTSLFVSGWEKGLERLGPLPVQPGLAVIEKDETPRWNGLFHKLWGPCASFLLFGTFGTLGFLGAARSAMADGDTLDLGAMGADSFAPYVTDRNPFWAILPVLAICLVLTHLKKDRRKTMRKKMPISVIVAALLLWSTVEKANAVVIEPLGSAIGKLLGGAKQAKQKKNGDQLIAYVPGSGGPKAVAIVEKGIYPPDCTHTWAIGINPKTGKVTEVRVVEMGCPHAFPTKEASFLDQFKGKGPADVKKLKDKIDIKAKATGTSNLATEAVQRAITGYQKMKAQLK